MPDEANENELLARELDKIGSRMQALDERVTDVEQIIKHLEEVAIHAPVNARCVGIAGLVDRLEKYAASVVEDEPGGQTRREPGWLRDRS